MIKDKTKKSTIGELSKLSIKELYELIKKEEEKLANNKSCKEWLEFAINLKYEKAFAAKRLRMGKDTGSISIDEDGYRITCDVAKKIEWQQGLLEEIYAQNTSELKDSITVYYKIPERAYSELSYEVQKMIEPARILTTGKASYKITKLTE